MEKGEEQKPAQTEEFCKLQGCVSSLSTYQPLLLAGLGTINHCLAPHFFLNSIQGHCWPGLTDPSAVSMRHILCSSRGEHKCLSWNSSNSGGDGTAIQRGCRTIKCSLFHPHAVPQALIHSSHPLQHSSLKSTHFWPVYCTLAGPIRFFL